MSLIDTIRGLARRILWVHGGSGLGWGLVVAAIALAFGVWLDLVWELSPLLRVANALGAAALVPLTLGLAMWLGLRRAQPDAVARRVDRLLGANGSVRAGVELALQTPEDDALSRGMAALAVDRAAREMTSVSPAKVAPVVTALRAWTGTGVIAIATIALAVMAPRFVRSEWLRWTDPFGDHPPYSRLVFHVDPEEVRVVYGTAADIRVRVEGGTAEKLDLMLQADGSAAETLPMFPEGPTQWRASLTRVTRSGQFWVRAGSARSVRYPLRVITVPVIEDVAFHVEPPAYTNRPAYEGPLPQGGITGLAGTKVTVRVRSNRPLSSGKVTFEAGDKSDRAAETCALATANEPTSVMGAFELRQPGKARLRIFDVEGQGSVAEFTIPIAIVTDEPPRIRITEPPAFSFATPTAKLPVALIATDDYGLARVELFRSLNDSRPLGAAEKLPTPAPLRWSGSTLLSLSSYGLTPGDIIKLQARAVDTDPAGPNVAESATVIVKIISQEDFDRLALAQRSIEMLFSKYQQAQRHMENLKNEVDRLRRKRKETKDDDAGRAALQKELDALADRLAKSAEALDKLAKEDLPYEMDELLKKHLAQASRQLQRLSERGRAAARGGGSIGPMFDSLEEMLRALEEMKDKLEKEAIIPLETLAAVEPFMEQAAIIELVHRRQKALVARLKDVNDNIAKDGWRRPATEARELQQDIRKMLTKALDKLEDLLADLDAKALDLEDFAKDVREFIDGLRGAGVIEAMSEAERELENFAVPRGFAEAKRALDLLEEFLTRHKPEDLANGAGGGQGRIRFTPGMRNALRQTLSQMLGERGFGRGEMARQNDNIGLYGGANLPQDFASSRAGKNSTSKKDGGGAAATRDSGDNAPRANETPGGQVQGSTGEAAVPITYRRRVADYFQRIADETSRPR
jgi:hypothetical protein